MTKKISSITIENYKAFRKKHTINLNNLTLFFGYNNTGKSALIRLFPLLKDSFNPNKASFFTSSYLDYSSSSIRGALYKQLTTNDERKLSFGLSWNSGESLEFSLQQNGLDPEIMSSLKITLEDKALEFQPYLEDMTKLENKLDPTDLVSFYNFRLPNNDTYNNLITNFSKSVHWISSTRIHPPRKFEIGIGIPLQIEPNGNGVGPLIWHLAENKSPSIDDINEWLLNTCDRALDFKDDMGSTDGRKFVSLETVSSNDKSKDDNDRSIRTPILDSGEGIAQALPVVVLCAMAANGELGEAPIIAVEQPELHLHPQATVELANFLIACIKKNPNVRYILETHSESFLRALQIAIVNGTLKTDDFSCYWVSNSGLSSNANPIEFDKDGFISSSWPQGVFREAINQAKELVNLRRSKAKK